MDPSEILGFIVLLVLVLFVFGYYIPRFNKKSKKHESFGDKLELAEQFGIGLLIYIPLVILIYVIFALFLNLSPNGAIYYQTEGGIVYYMSKMITSIPTFMSYLAGAYSTNFFYNIILLIFVPIISLTILRFLVGKFSNIPKYDLIVYTECVFIPSIAIIFCYLLALLFSPKYGIFFSSTNYSEIFIGFTVLVVGVLLLKFFFRISNFSTKIINSKKLTLYQRISPFLIIFILLLIYTYYYLGGAIGIYYQPYLTNVHISKVGWGAQLSGNVSLNTSNPTILQKAPFQVYLNVSENINFGKGVNFTVVPINSTTNISTIKFGLLPSGVLIGYRNYTVGYNQTNPTIPYGCSNYGGYCSSNPKFIVLSQLSNFSSGNVVMSIYSTSIPLIAQLFNMTIKTNRNCLLYNCTATFTIGNLTKGVPTSFYYHIKIPPNTSITSVSFTNGTVCRLIPNHNGTINNYNCFYLNIPNTNFLLVAPTPTFTIINQTQIWKRQWTIDGSANTLSRLSINLSIEHIIS